MKNLINPIRQKRLTTILMVFALLLFIPVAVSAQEVSLQQATSTLQNFGREIVNVVQIIIGIVGAMMIAWVVYKRQKGDQQSNDALMGWLVALAVAVLALQLIKAMFLR